MITVTSRNGRHVLYRHEGASLQRATLQGLILPRASFRGQDMRFADLSSGSFMGADFSAANITAGDLRGANISYSQFDAAVLERANLQGCIVIGCRFTNAHMRAAQLCELWLGPFGKPVDFQGADLRDASLAGAQLMGARFDGADLSGAELSGALYDTDTVWPAGYTGYIGRARLINRNDISVDQGSVLRKEMEDHSASPTSLDDVISAVDDAVAQTIAFARLHGTDASGKQQSEVPAALMDVTDAACDDLSTLMASIGAARADRLRVPPHTWSHGRQVAAQLARVVKDLRAAEDRLKVLRSLLDTEPRTDQ